MSILTDVQPSLKHQSHLESDLELIVMFLDAFRVNWSVLFSLELLMIFVVFLIPKNVMQKPCAQI
jgi:hypothetical protein